MTFSERVGEHIRHNVVGYIALFCFAIGGVAQALPGQNTVDSGDIKKGQVTKTDLATGAVTNAKLAPDAVGSANVIDNSLTGGDIDEGSLNAGGDLSGTLSAAAISTNAVGAAEPGVTEDEIADESVDSQDVENTERRILIPVGEINPPLTLGVAPGVTVLSGGAPAFVFASSFVTSVAVTTRIPDDRVPGTDVSFDFVWSPATAGAAGEEVVWALNFFSAGPGEDMTQSVSSVSAPPSSGQVADQQRVSTATIAAAFISNGDLLVSSVLRATASASDDHPGDAQLHLIAFRYTAQR